MNNSEPLRYNWIDWAKTIGIMLVVWGHISSICMKEIFVFHMPFFFMISGYLFKQKGIKQEFLSSVQTLLFPYIIYNMLFMLPLPFGGERSWHSVVHILLGNQEQLCYVMVPLWYIVALFVIRLANSYGRLNIMIMGVASMLLSILLFGIFQIDQTNDYFQIKTACFCMPFFVLGSLIKKIRIEEFSYTNKKLSIVCLIAALCCFILGMCIGIHNSGEEIDKAFHCVFGHNILAYYFSTSIICLSLLYIIYVITNNFKSKIVKSISKARS